MLTPLAIKIGALAWMPKLLPQITWLDRLIQRVTRGHCSILRIAGLPNLMLTVAGRKSGVLRSTPLLCVPYDEGQLIAGSNFGGAKPPVWVVNVRAADTVTVSMAGRTHTAVARELSGAERDGAWAAHGEDLAELREVRRAHRPGHPGLLVAAGRLIPRRGGVLLPVSTAEASSCCQSAPPRRRLVASRNASVARAVALLTQGEGNDASAASRDNNATPRRACGRTTRRLSGGGGAGGLGRSPPPPRARAAARRSTR